MVSPLSVRLTLAFLLLAFAPAAQAGPRAVVVVRHSETQPDGTRDPGLSSEGQRRAQALADSLADARLTKVVTSPYKRTHETAAPSSRRFELEPVTAGISREGGLKGHVAEVVDAVRAAPGGTVLVVGHSNTVPAILAALGGPALPQLAEDDHSSLFTVVLSDEGPPSVLRSRLVVDEMEPWDVTDPCPGVEFPEQASSPYVLPYPVGVTRNVRQGNCNEANSHHAGFGEAYAYDFEMPIGSRIVAARAGTVFAVRESFADDAHGIHEANFIAIDHGDGSYAKYGHLTQDGALAQVGETVRTGQVIALSGNSGLSRGPHLHFSVKQCPEGETVGGPGCLSVPVTFRNARPHPRGLIGSATSALGGGERYEALP